MATAYASAASTTAVLIPRTTTKSSARCSTLPSLAPRFSPSSSVLTSFKHLSEPWKSSLLLVRASSEESTPVDTTELLADLKEKWDAVENKSTVIIYGAGAIVAVWLSSIVIGAINKVPLLPKIMELVGLGYTGWFVYRYLLFKSSRKELATDIEGLKKKIAGAE